MKKILANPVFLLFTFLLACNAVSDSVYTKINPSQKGDFRNVFIRSSLEEVKKAESIPPKNEESDYLFYEIPLGEKDNYFTVGYSFNEKGLYEILLDVNLLKTEDALQLFMDIKEDLKLRYGNPRQEDETTLVWTIKTEKSEEVEITLTDESASYETGKISLSFYDLSY